MFLWSSVPPAEVMRAESLLLAVVAVLGGASACKYYCKVPNDGTYICCDDGNPFLDTAGMVKEPRGSYIDGLIDKCIYK